MNLFAYLILTLCLASTLAGAVQKTQKIKLANSKTIEKPKREAPLSGGGGYNGASYKYLPPAPSTGLGGYDSYSHHGGQIANTATAIGLDLGNDGAADFARASTTPTHGAGGGGGHRQQQGPRVETFIIQTQPANRGYSGNGAGGGGGGGGGGGYKYANGGQAARGYGGGAGVGGGYANAGGYQYSSSSSAGGHGQRYPQSFGHGGGGGGGVPRVQTIIIAGGGHKGSGASGSGGNYYSGKGAGGGVGGQHVANHGNGGFSGNANGAAAHAGHFGSFGGHFGGSASQSGYNYAPNLIGAGSTGYNGGGSANGYVSVHSGSSSNTGYRYSIGGASELLGGSSKFGAGVGGYSIGGNGFETGISHIGHSSSGASIGSSTSGIGSGYSYSRPLTSFTHSNSGSFSGGIADETPAYALGHKGLGHFSAYPSKEQILHTDFIDSSKYATASAHNPSKPPFTPSTFLGSTHESGIAYAASAPASSYLPPSSSVGYDYQDGSTGYEGGSSHVSLEPSTPIHEPETSYLPPIASASSSSSSSSSASSSSSSPYHK